MEKEWDVLLFGYYGFGNLGDELLARALVEGLEALGVPRNRVGVLSGDPDQSSRELGIRGVNRWHFPSVFRALRRSKSLLFGAGGLLQDATSLRSNCYYWGVVRLARAAGCLPWAFGQSLGPFHRPSSRFFARDAFKSCVSRVCRDDSSVAYLQSQGLPSRRCPDPVLSLSPSRSSEGGTRLLVNLRPWKDGLPEKTARAAAALGERCGLPLLGVALASEDRELLERCSREGILPCETIFQVRSLEDLWGLAGQACWALGMRLHFAVLCAMLEIPVTPVNYAPKVEAFAREWGLPLWDGTGEVPMPRKALAPGDHSPRECFLEELRRSLDEVQHSLGTPFSEVRHG